MNALPPPCDDGTSNLFRRFVIPEGTPNPPNLNGLWDGLYSSFGKGGDGSFHIDVTQCAERSIGDVNGIIAVLSRDFHGVEIIDGNTDEPYFFMGNFGPDNMFVVAGWNNFRDHFIVTGDYSPPDPNTGGMASAEGFYALTTGEGITDRGSLHDWVQKFLATPPDPEKCGGITNPPR